MWWLDPAQGHAPPSFKYGFNNWRTKGDAPIEMTPSTAMPVGARRGGGRGAGMSFLLQVPWGGMQHGMVPPQVNRTLNTAIWSARGGGWEGAAGRVGGWAGESVVVRSKGEEGVATTANSTVLTWACVPAPTTCHLIP